MSVNLGTLGTTGRESTSNVARNKRIIRSSIRTYATGSSGTQSARTAGVDGSTATGSIEETFSNWIRILEIPEGTEIVVDDTDSTEQELDRTINLLINHFIQHTKIVLDSVLTEENWIHYLSYLIRKHADP